MGSWINIYVVIVSGLFKQIQEADKKIPQIVVTAKHTNNILILLQCERGRRIVFRQAIWICSDKSWSREYVNKTIEDIAQNRHAQMKKILSTSRRLVEAVKVTLRDGTWVRMSRQRG